MPKVLHLVLDSDEEPYNSITNVTRVWYEHFKEQGVDTFFYRYSEDVSVLTIHAKESLVLFPGKESYVPGILNKTMDAFVLQHIFLDKAKRSQEQNKEEYRVLQTFKWQAWVLACRVRDTLNAMHMRSSEQEDDKKEKDEPLPKNILLKNPGHFLSVNVLPLLVWKCKRGDGGDMVDFLNEHDSLVSLIKDKKSNKQ